MLLMTLIVTLKLNQKKAEKENIHTLAILIPVLQKAVRGTISPIGLHWDQLPVDMRSVLPLDDEYT